MLAARGGQARRPIDAAGIARRRWMVTWTKRVLPVLALCLLASIALWPQFEKLQERGRVTFRQLTGTAAAGGQVSDPRYRGVDERGRPYTLTAKLARQSTPKRFDLTEPRADITTDGREWLMVQSREGVYAEDGSILDLSGNVILYRNDGTTLTTEAATMDLKLGAAANELPVHAEGPFGMLDASGFSVTDKGDVLNFIGPARLSLNFGQ